MFMKFATVGDTIYFPTFRGFLQPVKMADGAPVPGKSWHFAKDSKSEPSGWQVITADHNGLLYVLMLKGAKEGDHKSGGEQVWVLDPEKQEIVRKIALKTGAISIEVTRAKKPQLAVTNFNMEIDVYDLESDELVRTIGNFLSANPFVLHAAEIAG
jgi:methylamine dehydrogenase heavy chain